MYFLLFIYGQFHRKDIFFLYFLDNSYLDTKAGITQRYVDNTTANVILTAKEMVSSYGSLIVVKAKS